MKFYDNIKNSFDFFLRNRLVFSRKNYSERNECKEGLFEDSKNTQKALEQEKYLLEKYDLEYLKNNSTRQNYLENLYILDILDKYLTIEKECNNVLDVGSKNWCYAKGEHAFFKKHCNNFQLDGIELDSNRLYSNLYSRKEAAKFYIRGLEKTKYIEGDFLNLEKKYDYIIWILPFIVEEPLIKWGLPLKYFKPEQMLQHTYNLLNPGGTIFILNQGEKEFEIQKLLCEKLNILYTPFGEVKSKFLHYNIERYLTIIKK